MDTKSSQITSLTIVYSAVYSDADQTKHQSSASLAFVRGIHRGGWWCNWSLPLAALIFWGNNCYEYVWVQSIRAWAGDMIKFIYKSMHSRGTLNLAHEEIYHISIQIRGCISYYNCLNIEIAPANDTSVV